MVNSDGCEKKRLVVKINMKKSLQRFAKRGESTCSVKRKLPTKQAVVLCRSFLRLNGASEVYYGARFAGSNCDIAEVFKAPKKR